MSGRLWHGGVPGLQPGDMLTADPNRSDHFHRDCLACQARAEGAPLPGDDLDPTKVYVTSDREYARVYAAGYPRGDLYIVRPIGLIAVAGPGDARPTWTVGAAEVVSVYDRCVTATAKQVRRWSRMFAQPWTGGRVG